MAIVAELRFSAPGLFLAAASRTAPDTTITVVHQAGMSGLLFSASGGDLDALEAALEDEPTLGDYRLVDDVGGRRFYTGTVDLDRPFFSGVTVSEGVVILENAVRNGEWTLRLQLPGRETLGTLAGFCRDHDIAMHVDRLYVEDPSEGPDVLGLTQAQREVLLAAKERGYFEDPRAITLEELAGELGVSPTALGRRMRRALSTLLERTIEADE